MTTTWAMLIPARTQGVVDAQEALSSSQPGRNSRSRVELKAGGKESWLPLPHSERPS